MPVEVGLIPDQPVTGQREAEIGAVRIVNRLVADGRRGTGWPGCDWRQQSCRLENLERIRGRGPENVNTLAFAVLQPGNRRGGFGVDHAQMPIRMSSLEGFPHRLVESGGK